MKHCPPRFTAVAVAPCRSRPEATIRRVAADPGITSEALRNRVRAAGVSRLRGRRAEASAEPPTPLEAEKAALRKAQGTSAAMSWPPWAVWSSGRPIR